MQVDVEVEGDRLMSDPLIYRIPVVLTNHWCRFTWPHITLTLQNTAQLRLPICKQNGSNRSAICAIPLGSSDAALVHLEI